MLASVALNLTQGPIKRLLRCVR